MALYNINKGINRPIEFKGLKAQYIGYLGAGLVLLLIVFAALYLLGAPMMICILIITILGSLLFYHVYKLSYKYGQYGLMKKAAKKYLPVSVTFRSRKIFTSLKK
ncbi:DUF4133 domain-containing protein [Mucilaginibacter ginkgonis]|uniref:DUF4133 domain-containing protein n=1 Tax=Mucilaginibacter ginkgonis TaxID=2682091 RepID=A0A6I4HW80_9SPHI|nr:DUF4133 domain-containing protein [Mucilaginibacter ginkgonis]QQL50161.1 DUF4133 domain-containing protein [Mucilaginibacter ginkgonis]